MHIRPTDQSSLNRNDLSPPRLSISAAEQRIQEVSKEKLVSKDVARTSLLDKRLSVSDDTVPPSKRFKSIVTEKKEELALESDVDPKIRLFRNIPITQAEKKQIDEYTGNHSTFKFQREECENKIKQLKNKPDHDEEKLSQLVKERDSIYIRELQTQCNRSMFIRSFIEKYVTVLKVTNSEMELRIDELDQQIEHLQREIDEMKKQKIGQDFIVFSCTMTNKELNKKVETLQKENVELESQLNLSSSLLEKSKLESDETITLLTKKTFDMQKKLNAESKKSEELFSELEETKSELTESKAKVQHAQDSLNIQTEQNQRLYAEMQVIENEKQNLAKAVEDINQANELLKIERAKIRSDLQKKGSDLEMTELELEAMRTRCEQFEVQNSKANEIYAQNQQLSVDNAALRQQCLNLQMRVRVMEENAITNKRKIQAVTQSFINQINTI